jgi:hypothetical protein
MQMRTCRWLALAATAALMSGCAAQTPEQLREASTGRVTKVLPIYLESETAPGLGSAFTKKSPDRPGYRISVLTNDNMLIEVAQEQGGFKVGDMVRIEGYGTNAKILPR